MSCDAPCHADEHYLTIAHWDGSMHHTVHVELAQLIELAHYAGPDQLVVFREIARESLLCIDPPDRAEPAREGSYVVTPPKAARVSAASIVTITEEDRMRAKESARR